MLRPFLCVLSTALLVGLSSGACAAARTFVATGGSDGNTAVNCSRAAPCRSFASALTVTNAGGEIIVLDSGGYGPVTIDKSVSIIAPEGIYAGISVPSGNGITIATGGIHVVLRGLDINSDGADADYGIAMTSAQGTLLVENCRISGFSKASPHRAGLFVNAFAEVRVVRSVFRRNHIGALFQGMVRAQVSDSQFANNVGGLTANSEAASDRSRVTVERTVSSSNGNGFSAYAFAGATQLALKDCVASENTSNGIEAYAAPGAFATLSVANSLVSESGFGGHGLSGATGIYAFGAGARIVVSGSTITGNDGYGMKQQDSGVIVSTGDNSVSENGLGASSGPLTPLTKM